MNTPKNNEELISKIITYSRQMASLKKQITNFFGFSRSETNGFIILLPLIVLIIFSEPIYSHFTTHSQQQSSTDKIALDSMIALWKQPAPPTIKTKTANPQPTTSSLFPFDPNVVNNKQLIDLGFSDKLALRLIHYRLKGGRFKSKPDLLKIYGVDSALYRKLFPYIQITTIIQTKTEKPFTGSLKNTYEKKEVKQFDLNNADTTQLKSVYGIGTVLAKRIIKYRDVLGGFINTAQTKEVYGLDTAVINKLSKASYLTTNFQPVKININTADEMELDKHPYITRPIAKAIVAYRFQHGNFNNVEEIRKLSIINPDIATKIIPYLKIEN